MDDKKIILFIFFSIVSVILIYLSYTGITRYLKIDKFDGVDSQKKYAQEYLKLDRVNYAKKVIVSLKYDKDMTKSLNSLLDQTVRPDQIIVTTDRNINIDQFLFKNNILIQHKLDDVDNDCISLLSPLLREKDGNTIIILANPGVIYGVEFIEKMTEMSQQHPSCIIYNKSYCAKETVDTGYKKVSDKYVNDVIDSAYGVLIKPKFFSADILNDCKNNLDVLLTINSIKNGTCCVPIQYNENIVYNVGKNANLIKELSFNASNLSSFR